MKPLRELPGHLHHASSHRLDDPRGTAGVDHRRRRHRRCISSGTPHRLSLVEPARMKVADSLPLIEKLPQCKSSQEVGVAFADFVAPHGFIATACGESRDTPEGRRWEFFFNTWPAEWLLQYQQNDFVRHDLLPMVARFSAQTFTWLEALRGRTPTAKQREHHEWARGIGIVDAIAVPIHYPCLLYTSPSPR